jgi:hypothetical protein
MEKKKDKIKIKKMGNGKKRGREIVKKKKTSYRKLHCSSISVIKCFI